MTIDRDISLRIRFLLLLTMMLLPALGMIVYAVWASYQHALTDIHGNALDLARQLATRQAGRIEVAHGMLQSLAEVRVVRNGKSVDCNTFLAQQRGNGSRYQNIAAIKPNGDIYCSAVPMPEGKVLNVARKTAFRGAMDTGQFYVGEYQVGMITGNPNLGIALPIRKSSGQRYVVYAAIALDWLESGLREGAAPTGTTLMLIDRYGTVLVRYPENAAWQGKSIQQNGLAEVLKHGGEQTFEAMGMDGHERLYAIAPITHDGMVGAYLAIGIPKAVAYKMVQRELQWQLAALGLLTGILLLGWLGAEKFIFRPVTKLVDAVQDAGRGERFVAPQVKGEIGLLGHAFAQTLDQIAAREMAEQESNLRYHQLFDEALDMIHMVDSNGLLIDANRAELTTLGYSHEELIGKHLDKLIAPRMLAITKSALLRVLVGEAVRGFETVLVSKTGQEIPVEVNAAPHWQEGRVVAARAILRNISKRKKVEQELRHREQLLTSLIVHVPAPIVILDKNLRYIVTSLRWRQNYGLEEQDIVGRLHYEVLPDMPKKWRDVHQRCLAGAVEKCEEDRFDRADGSTKWLNWEAHPWYRTDGTIGGIIIYAEDITERKMGETRHDELQRQLLQAQRMESIGQLTSGIAHDFNNILASIMGYAELALQRHAPDRNGKLADYLGEISLAGGRARDLIAKMLAFSRGAKNKGHAQPVAPWPMVKEVAKLLASTLPSSIELTTKMETELPLVQIDPVQLHQVIMNLCVNARDAVGVDGHVSVRVRHVQGITAMCDSCHGDFNGNFVEFAVQDDGAGMPMESIAHIFDPFFTTKEVGKGTGMGLSVVHGIVHEQGGHILVESIEGRGTTMRILLPAAPATASTMNRLETQIAPTVAGATGRIMVVDDERSVAHLLGEALRHYGWEVEVYTDSLVALARFLKAPQEIQAVVTDQTMPAISGHDLTQAIRTINSNIPIILCTGYSDQIDEQSAKKIGVTQFFQKPMELQVLAQALRDEIARANSEPDHQAMSEKNGFDAGVDVS